MSSEENLDVIAVKIKADLAEAEKDIVNFRRKYNADLNKDQNKLSFKAKFDTAIAQLRISELQKLRQKLQTEFDKKVQMNVDSASLERTRQKIASIDQQLQGIQKTGSEVPSLFTKIGAAIGGAFALQKIIRFGFEAVQLAAKAEGVERAFNNLNQPGLLDNLRRATRGTVSDLELMQVSMRAANFKIPLTELSTLLEFAKKRATQTGQEVDYLVNSIIDGIGRKSPLVLDNLGISAAELQQEFKKTGDFGKAAANIISREMSKMGDVIDTTADQMARLNAEIENQKVKLGKDIQPLWVGTLKVLGMAIGAFNVLREGVGNMIGVNLRYKQNLADMIQEHQQYANMLVSVYKEQRKLAALIVSTYKQKLNTTYADDVLKNYYEEKNQIEQIRNKLKDTNISAESRNVLQKELNSLLDKQNEKDKVKEIRDHLIEIKNEYKSIQDALKNGNLSLAERVSLVDRELQLRKELNDLYLRNPEIRPSEEAFNLTKSDKKLNIGVNPEDVTKVGETEKPIIDDKDKSSFILISETGKEFRDSIGEAVNSVDDIANILGIGADTFISKLISGLSTAVRLAEDISNLINAVSNITSIATLLFGHSGGEFVGTSSGVHKIAAAAHAGGEFSATQQGIMKLASGGSFMVPPGFPNDSFPLMVETGERIIVNPASSVGSQDRLLSSIDKKLMIMNYNLIENSLRDTKRDPIAIIGKIENDAIYFANKKTTKKRNLFY